jgi:hypothetical protein
MPRRPAEQTVPRRFQLVRQDDAIVADGVRFVDGLVVLRRRGEWPSVVVYDSFAAVAAIYVRDTDGIGMSVNWLDPVA